MHSIVRRRSASGLEVEDGVALEDGGITWHGDHISPLQSLTLHDALAARLCMHHYNMMPLTPDDDPRR